MMWVCLGELARDEAGGRSGMEGIFLECRRKGIDRFLSNIRSRMKEFDMLNKELEVCS